MNYEIRYAEEDDADEILSLWYEYSDHLSQFDARYEHKADAGDQWRDYFLNRMVGSSKASVFVADSTEVEGLLGVIEVRVMGAHPIFQLDQHGMIFGHHVRSGYQRQGIEAALLDKAEEWFKHEQNLSFYRMNVLAENHYLGEIYEEYGLEQIEHTYEGEL
ncbi:GNAT family N-acetyltransferase [Haloarchaeobius litoreus]|uniref:GNAT family N-acetyltransferase n=1 Tax=Haloarchaeobius litoreus TaxID=755306 RepID=A0ABD6DNM9_9EURY|nr:GNAT family N-acetyltransferase [Haloarchaeobius litoreus]